MPPTRKRILTFRIDAPLVGCESLYFYPAHSTEALKLVGGKRDFAKRQLGYCESRLERVVSIDRIGWPFVRKALSLKSQNKAMTYHAVITHS